MDETTLFLIIGVSVALGLTVIILCLFYVKMRGKEEDEVTPIQHSHNVRGKHQPPTQRPPSMHMSGYGQPPLTKMAMEMKPLGVPHDDPSKPWMKYLDMEFKDESRIDQKRLKIRAAGIANAFKRRDKGSRKIRWVILWLLTMYDLISDYLFIFTTGSFIFTLNYLPFWSILGTEYVIYQAIFISAWVLTLKELVKGVIAVGLVFWEWTDHKSLIPFGMDSPVFALLYVTSDGAIRIIRDFGESNRSHSILVNLLLEDIPQLTFGAFLLLSGSEIYQDIMGWILGNIFTLISVSASVLSVLFMLVSAIRQLGRRRKDTAGDFYMLELELCCDQCEKTPVMPSRYHCSTCGVDLCDECKYMVPQQHMDCDGENASVERIINAYTK